MLQLFDSNEVICERLQERRGIKRETVKGKRERESENRGKYMEEEMTELKCV